MAAATESRLLTPKHWHVFGNGGDSPGLTRVVVGSDHARPRAGAVMGARVGEGGIMGRRPRELSTNYPSQTLSVSWWRQTAYDDDIGTTSANAPARRLRAQSTASTRVLVFFRWNIRSAMSADWLQIDKYIYIYKHTRTHTHTHTLYISTRALNAHNHFYELCGLPATYTQTLINYSHSISGKYFTRRQISRHL